MKGLYIHIPFCLSKCAYCDFNSYADKWQLANEYIDALLAEAELFHGQKADTVYIGGGTPTALAKENLCRLISGITDIFDIPKEAEFTVEMNPETADEDYLKSIRELGANRISLGAQSFDNGLLKTLGRVHTAEKTEAAIVCAKNAGFENISLDLMFSLPGQSLKQWKKTLKKAVCCDIRHISCYGLKIEEGTPFYENGIRPLPEDVDRKMYHYAIEFLKENGFEQYEISNFAKKGFQSRHNLKYWHCAEYFGLGAGAHFYISRGGLPTRGFNVSAVEEYIKRVRKDGNAVQEQNALTAEDIKIEKIIMGLRLTEGIEIELVENAEIYVNGGFMEQTNGKIRFTEKGFDVSNEILCRII